MVTHIFSQQHSGKLFNVTIPIYFHSLSEVPTYDNNNLFLVPYVGSLERLFSSSRVKEWAINDLKRTISWLESQEVKVSGTCWFIFCD